MLQLLAELYASSPEEGDLDRPKLILFVDEAHLIFNEASDALLDQLEMVIKLIRSKGIGIIFCTQNPQDVPAPILSQLGLKIQHALRAFTAADRKTIKQAAENFPVTDFYQADELITQLGIGEALVTLLNEKGIPTPLVHTLLCTPRSRMDVLTDQEIAALVGSSKLVAKYAGEINSDSAYDKPTGGRAPKEESIFDNPVVREVGKTAANIITRSLLGALGLGGRSSRRKSLF
jgi:hypothetical protein